MIKYYQKYYQRVEIYDEELKKFVKKQDKRRKTFKTLAEERKWLHQIEVQKAEAKEKKVVFKNEGIRLVDVAEEFLELKRKQAQKGKIKDSYVGQLRIQTAQIEEEMMTELEKATKQAQNPILA